MTDEKQTDELAKESEPAQTSTETRPDPTLLGVDVPLTMTFDAMREIATAWKTCIVALRHALTAKLKKTAEPAAAPATES